MAALQCDNFVGNAWKKDLCLNCYRSKEEHHHARHDCFKSLIQTRIPDPPKEGILKRVKTKKAKNKVIFTNAECEVIGFGGDDSYSDDDYPELSFGPSDEVDDVVEESEEEKAFHKLTKTNTDYNSIAENLQEPKEGEVKKVIEPLKLGKLVLDEKGNKKTLLVSVTPFGNQQTTTIKNRINANGFMLKMNGHLTSTENSPLTTKPAKKPLEPSNNDCVKNGNVIGEKTVEISQLNGESKNKDDEDVSGGKISNDKSQIKRSQPLDKNFKFRLIKELHKETEKTPEAVDKDDRENVENSRLKAADKMNSLLDKAKEKVNQFPVITDNSNFKFKAKVFAQAKKPALENNNSSSNSNNNNNNNNNNKAVVLDMYDIGREAKGVKTTNRVNIEKSIKEGGVISSEIRAKFLTVDSKENPNFSEDSPNGDSPDKKVQKALPVIERTKLIPNVSSLYRHRTQSISPPKEEVDDVANGSTVKHLMNGVVSSSSVVSSVECVLNKNLKSVGDETESNGREEEAIDLKKSDEENSEDSPRKEIQFKRISIENLDKIIKGEEIILFSADGAVDPTETDKNGELKVTEDSRSGLPTPLVPPVLPTKPPPPLFESRSSFLNDMTAVEDEGQRSGSEKPKVPAKPILIQSRRTNFQSPSHANRPRSPSMEKFLDAATSCTPPAVKSHTPLQESLSSDSGKNQKRPAPKPPSPKEESSQRTVAVMNGDEEQRDENKAKPETEAETKADEATTPKRISRSTENLLKYISGQDEKSQLSMEGLEELAEPATRRTLSLSQDNLMPCEISDGHSKKKFSRGKFFLHKLLHLGKAKEGSKDLSNQNHRQQGVAPIAAVKPKPEIIHPSDLSGSRVEVLPLARTFKSRRTSSSASSSSGELRESDILSDSSASQSVSSSGNDSSCTNDRTKKPPPPPRAHSIDAWNTKPARPPPPMSVEVVRENTSSWCNGADSKSDNYYVNLGEARSGLMPNKPLRTGSLREAAADDVKRMVVASNQPEDSDYESFIVPSASPQIEDNLYECLQPSNHRSSLPECDSLASENPKSIYAKGINRLGRDVMQHRRSEGNVDLNGDCLKMKFLRSVSLPYCASETESEIYSPYSFYGSELGEEDCEMATSNQILRMSRLKLKRGRSIVHKNLEDNYGAVVVANHEALAQVVELMHQGPAIPPPLRALTTAVNLRWTDFAIAKDEAGVVVERRVFYPALWGTHNVTLGLMAEQTLNSSLHAKGPFSLNPIAELNDLVPACYLPMLKKDSSELIQASISVMARLQIETVESYGRNMRIGVYTDESKKEVNFVLLQIINAFKNLQAQGIEEVSRNLTNLAVCREEKDPHPRICITDSFERSDNRESLCRCLIHAIKDILPPTDLTSLLSSVLLREKAVSLSQAKGILEFVLWGPADIAFGNPNRERESALQRWLDLERATVLHGLVRTRAELTVFEEWQLLFLVRTSAKMMAEASLLLENGIADEVTTH